MTASGRDTDDSGLDTKYSQDGICFPGKSTKGSKQHLVGQKVSP